MRRIIVTDSYQHMLTTFRLWIVAVVVSGLLFSVDQIGWLYWLRGAMERSLFSIDQLVTQRIVQPLGAPLRWLIQAHQADQTIHDLSTQVREMSVALARVDRLPWIAPAHRSVRLIHYSDRALIAAGSVEGVEIGRVITDSEGVLIGRVVKIGRYFSDVQVVTTPDNRVAVETVNRHSKGVVEFREERLWLTGVLQSEPLEIGDVLVTSGLDAVYPPGLIVGTVAQLSGTTADVTRGGIITRFFEWPEWVYLW